MLIHYQIRIIKNYNQELSKKLDSLIPYLKKLKNQIYSWKILNKIIKIESTSMETALLSNKIFMKFFSKKDVSASLLI